MSIRKFHLSERSHVAEELTKSGPTDIERKCMVIQQVVSDGDFSLEEALSMYDVEMNDYIIFVSHNLTSVLSSMIGQTSSARYSELFSIYVIFEFQKSVIMPVDKKFPEIVEHYQELSNSVKVKVS